MSFKLNERQFGHTGLLRGVRSFVCGYPEVAAGPAISQGAGGSVGNGELFVATGPNAPQGQDISPIPSPDTRFQVEIVMTCTTGGGNDAAIFSVEVAIGSPPSGLPSPIPAFGDLTAGQEYLENDVHLFLDTSTDWVVGNLIEFTLGPSTNTTPWEEKRWLDSLDDSPMFSGEIEWIASGPGDSSPRANITVGVQTETDIPSTRFNWRVNYFDAFTDTSPETSYGTQPNISTDLYMLYNNLVLDWHITVSSRRFMVFGVLSTGVGFNLYQGLWLPLAGVSAYPYPIAVGAAASVSTFTQGTQEPRHSSFWDPGGTATAAGGNLVLRFPDGTHLQFVNKTGAGEPPIYTDLDTVNIVAPLGRQHSLTINSGQDLLARIERGPSFDLGSPPAPRRDYMLHPNTLCINPGVITGQTLGQLDGVFFISGESNTRGNTLILESPEVTYLVVRDPFRSDFFNYAAARMDP